MPSSLRTPPALLRAYERHARSLPRFAEVVLVILLAHAAAVLAWQLLPQPQALVWQAPRAAAPAPGSAGAAPTGPNIDLIADSHLFGEAVVATDPALSELTGAPDTRLDLTLLGILSATLERGSRALIGTSNGEEKPYAIGDDVVRGVRLQAIFPDRVILARGSQLEALRLNKDAPSQGLPLAATEQPVPTTDTSRMLTTIRQELLNDPSRASEYIRVQPASSGGQLKGYRLYPGRDRGAFNAVGLRPGDLVTQVNGIQLNDANTALQMLGQLSQAGSVSLVVERGGQQQTVNVNFN